jgi:hypothetical protein
LTWGEHRSGLSTYKAQNAYGAVFEVTSTQSEEYGVSFHLSKHWKKSQYVMTVPVPIDKARGLKYRLRVMMVCTLNHKALYSWATTSGEATFTDPYSILLQLNYVRVIRREFWIFDTETGEVFGKYGDIGS